MATQTRLSAALITMSVCASVARAQVDAPVSGQDDHSASQSSLRPSWLEPVDTQEVLALPAAEAEEDADAEVGPLGEKDLVDLEIED